MCFKPILKQIVFNPLQQLLRERQQMASRPFASVDVALEVGAEQTDFLRGPLEVGTVVLRGGHCDSHIYVASVNCVCLWAQTKSDYLELTKFSYIWYAIFKGHSFNSMTWAVAEATGGCISLGRGDSTSPGRLSLTDRSCRNLRYRYDGRNKTPIFSSWSAQCPFVNNSHLCFINKVDC